MARKTKIQPSGYGEMPASEAGRIGGKRLVQKYGTEHMAQLGRTTQARRAAKRAQESVHPKEET